jgi:hypothetical protein
MDGYKVTGELFIGGQEAKSKVPLSNHKLFSMSYCNKADAVGEAIVSRASKLIRSLGMNNFRGTKVEALGAEHTYGEHAEHSQTREVVLRLTAHHDEMRALQVFLMEIAPV